MRKALFLDVTKTFESRFATGIQRVVRELVRRSAWIGELLDLDVDIVVATRSGYYRLDKDAVSDLVDPPRSPSAALVMQSSLTRIAKRVVQAIPPIYAFLQRRSVNRRMRVLTAGLEPITAKHETIVILIDSFGNGSPSVEAILRAKRAGASTIAIVYDAIPLEHPEMTPSTTAYPFRRAFNRLAVELDGLITISRSSADEIRRQDAVVRSGTPVTSFYLGRGIPIFGNAALAPSIPEIAWQGGPTFIMIGSIEPRKRHAAVLAAFDRLWDAGTVANLVMIGRIGWEIEDFVSQARSHPRYGTNLFLCHEVDDMELQYAMMRASATIIASKAEGFGLPIVESLALGVPVIASDIPIFREVAGDAGCFFPPDDLDEFARVIARFIESPDGYRVAARAFQWINWDDSARQFTDAVQSILAEVDVNHPDAGASAE